MITLKKTGTAKAPPKNRLTKISVARKAAFNILLAVERGQSHSDDLLRSKAVNDLSAPDRNLATALVLGVLRWQIQLDHEFHALLSHPDAKLDPEVRIALRLGAFQILHMDRIPARAAIDESVELAKQIGQRFASGMVTAVLRKLAKPSQAAKTSTLPIAESAAPSRDKRQGTTLVVPQTQQNRSGALAPAAISAEESKALAQVQAHPDWIFARWVNFYGLKVAHDLCRHGQSQPVLTVRLTSPAVEAELVASGIALEAGELLTAARAVLAGDVTATEAFREGCLRLQNEGSQLVAEIAGQGIAPIANSPRLPLESILDACAAPGGKTLILAEHNPTAHIVACESSAPRLEQLQKRLAFLGDRVECRRADAAALTDESAYDLVLADVPCSGTGTLGRNPEIRHRLRPEDLTRQAERQQAILQTALRAVRPGGRVVYSTCSLEPEENEQVVAAVLAATPSARLSQLEARIGELLAEGILTPSGAERLQASITPEGCLRLLPGTFHTDGFFICVLEREASPSETAAAAAPYRRESI